MTEPTTPTPTWRVVALVGRVGSREVLVDAAGDVVRLPTVPDPIAVQPYAADAHAAVAVMLGVPLAPLRLTWLPAEDWRSGWIVVEAEPLDVVPAGYRWLDPSLTIERLEPDDARDVVRRRLGRLDGGSAPLEPPWARAGWFDRTAAWMVERMADAGLPTSEAPQLVYQGPLAAVLRARSDGQAMFLKCAAPAFAHEAAITHALARRTPEAVPRVIASEPAENWLLMHDHGGQLLDEGPEAAWVEAMPRVAQLQRSWIGATGAVAAAGGQTRPLDVLARTLPSMLDRDGLDGRLAPEVRDAWNAAIPRLQEACAVLDDLGLPDALVHGDLHPGNIVVTPEGHRLVDWSDAAVGHPFVDLPTFLLRTKDAALRRRLRDAYIGGWDGFQPNARLEPAADLAMAVGALYQVATYQALLPAMDLPDRALFDGADASWVKRTLEGLEHGIDAGLA